MVCIQTLIPETHNAVNGINKFAYSCIHKFTYNLSSNRKEVAWRLASQGCRRKEGESYEL